MYKAKQHPVISTCRVASRASIRNTRIPKNLQNPSPWNTTSRIGSVKNLLHNTFPTGRSHPLNLVRICQGDTTHLACPNNEVLSISDAMYGRTVSGTVSHIRRYKSHTQIQVTYADTRIERYTLSQCLFDVL